MARKPVKPKSRPPKAPESWWTEAGFQKQIMAQYLRDRAVDLQREAERLREAARILDEDLP